MAAIRTHLRCRGLSIAEEIRLRKLYLRVSVAGACNLRCPFCHNEGGPTRGLLALPLAKRVFEAAAHIGFDRVQLTGGEPLIRPDLPRFVLAAREHFDSVGITTNGTYLSRRLDELLEAGLTSLHISLQEAELVEDADEQVWRIPDWLPSGVERAQAAQVEVRLNLPLKLFNLAAPTQVLRLLAPFQLDVRTYALLPSPLEDNLDLDGRERLAHLAEAENNLRREEGHSGRVYVRSYAVPTGIRCRSCDAFEMCREQSRSLRVGVDGYLRPCLASRSWDIPFTDDNVQEQLVDASLLALDFAWPRVEDTFGCVTHPARLVSHSQDSIDSARPSDVWRADD